MFLVQVGLPMIGIQENFHWDFLFGWLLIILAGLFDLGFG